MKFWSEVVVMSELASQVFGVEDVVDYVDGQVLNLSNLLVRIALFPAQYFLLLPLVMSQRHLLLLV